MRNAFGVITAIAAISLAACASLGGSTSPPQVPAQEVVPKSTPASNASPAATSTATPVPSLIAAADQNIQPELICIEHKPWDGRYFLRFGYNSNESSAVQIAIDSIDGVAELNQVIVTPASGGDPYEFTGQPTVFLSGPGNVAFDLPVNQKDSVTWYLDGNALTATTNGAPQCP